jgi:chromosome segregation ATPase
MTDEELRKLLAEIRDELKGTATDDKRERKILGDLIDDIEALLGRSKHESIEPEESMLGRLEEAIEDLEAHYPTLTDTLSNLLTALSNVGI